MYKAETVVLWPTAIFLVCHIWGSFMKNRLLFIGIICLALAFGAVLAGCDLGSGPTGTVILYNDSGEDGLVVVLYDYNSGDELSSTPDSEPLLKDELVKFKNAPANQSLLIGAGLISDPINTTDVFGPFTISENETVQFSYTKTLGITKITAI